MVQGDVYLVNLEPVIRTEIGKTRPGMILSINAMNQNSPGVILAPISSYTRKVYPFEIFIPGGIAGLKTDSKIMLDQMRSIDKKRLVKRIGTVTDEIRIMACAVGQDLISA
jgi:mRNA interferase MazF